MLSDYSPAPQATARPAAPPPPALPRPAPPPLALPRPAPPPVAPPPVRAERSPLGRLASSVIVLALGVMGLLDLSGVSVPAGLYVAVPLAVVGLGLVIGTFYGRARWLIGPGVVLTLVLGVATIAENVSDTNGSVTWRPASIDQLDRAYKIDVGDAVLDLSDVDFNGHSYTLSVDVGVGDLTVIVPAEVDVRVDARVDMGNANVLGNSWSGIGQPTRTVSDNGADGRGGGTLVIDATVDVGNVEVRR